MSKGYVYILSNESMPGLERYKHLCAERRKEIEARKVVQIGVAK